MRDYLRRPGQRTGSRKTVGVRELKTRAAHILRQVREAQRSYLLTRRGRAIGVILPVDGEDEANDVDTVDATAAWVAFLRAGRRQERRFPPDARGVRLLSDMRR